MAKSSERLRRERAVSRQRANERGVFAVRRPIDPQSFDLFDEIEDKLTPRFRGKDRLFTPKTITVTVLGFSRFSEVHKESGPPTSDIVSEVSSFKEPVIVRLGRLGIYGNEEDKLAFELHGHNRASGPQLEDEIEMCEKVSESLGFPLVDDYFSTDGYVPHCSIAGLHRSNVPHHKKRSIIRSYNRLLDVNGSEVVLAPPIDRNYTE